MRVEKSDDRAYPYTIKGGWGDKVYCTVADLKEIRKQINAILKEEKNKKVLTKWNLRAIMYLQGKEREEHKNDKGNND